ncbi:MAG: hypothetical protein M3Y86_13155 [Verrucomicrobiota bacterium]|nr:hypothetical protein [Verrucomicrobiota bacterium]
MIRRAWLLVLGGILLAGCTTAKKVAVTSFHVVDAPAHYIREHIDSEDGATTTTTTQTTTTSDVANPGYAVTEPTPPPQPPPRSTPRPHVTTAETRVVHSSPTPTKPRSTTTSTSTSASSSRKSTASGTPRANQTSQFPTARPVPGRPGYVYSIDPNGGMIDVTGYKSGDRAKDPYSKQIFIVP